MLMTFTVKGQDCLSCLIIMMKVLKDGMFSSFTRRKGKGDLSAAGSEYSLACLLFIVPFTVRVSQLHLDISWMSRPGTGWPLARLTWAVATAERKTQQDVGLWTIAHVALLCFWTKKQEAYGSGAYLDGRDGHVDPPHQHRLLSTTRGRQMQKGPQASQGGQWLDLASSATPGTA